MGTFEDADGVYEGKYEVAITPAPLRNPDRPPPDWPPFNARFGRYDQSGLLCNVTASHNKYNITVEK